ncbi:hypothetical protein LIER_34584 [Lithospermum erythrorhizon]|uniref:Uncharacterized protein n=1 Tax=Lithospermum erythrorhizon TaxID=34254 RepID=A0AAV3RZX3_LITER
MPFSNRLDSVLKPDGIESDSLSFTSQAEVPNIGGHRISLWESEESYDMLSRLSPPPPPVNKPTVKISKKRCRKDQLEIRTVRKGEEEDNSLRERENQKRPVPHKKVDEIPFNPANREQAFRVGTKLDGSHREELISLIREFEDVFEGAPKICQE